MKNLLIIVALLNSLILLSQTSSSTVKKQGYWKQKDPKTNKIIFEGEFNDDKPVGKIKYYYPNDSVRAIIIFNKNGKTAYAKLFHITGKRMGEGKYICESLNVLNRDSIWYFYDEAGVLISKDRYINGKKEGTCFVYLPNGQVAEERNFKKDILDGPFTQYFDGVKLKGKGNYNNGSLEGKTTYYYPNGVEVATGYYLNGKKNGPWIYKLENGKIKEKELYKKGDLASKKETDEFFAKSKSAETQKTNTVNPKSAGDKGTKK
jgi:antitoxin component YwqK of YwqJK toxin-antitoxin module